MAGIEKIVEKMKSQPNGIRPEEAQKVLCAYGYRLYRQKGSHMQFVNSLGDVVTIPNKTPIKAVYVKDILYRIGK